MKWISVKKKTPEPYKEVLLIVDGFDIPIQGYFSDNLPAFCISTEVQCASGNGVGRQAIPYYVSHWAELPEIP